MGIPNLITHLRRHAEVRDLRGQNIVIDGPALAYHVYFLCLNLRPEARNPYEASPTYKELGQAVILWLDHLEAHHLTIKKIFFDGFLPASKKEVRVSRHVQQTQRIVNYRAANWIDIPSTQQPTPPLLTLESLFSSGHAIKDSQSTELPPATFQVAAVIEALCTSEKYRSMIKVVPDEADSFCANYVRENGGVIITGDSDLLVHDLGTFGSVVFLTDLDLLRRSLTRTLTCCQYLPKAIAGGLLLTESDGLLLQTPDGLKNFAFALSRDYQAPLHQLLKNSKDATYLAQHQEMYAEFSADYEPLLPAKRAKPDVTFSKTLEILQTLHPRTSEFILQFPYFSELTWSSFSLRPHPPHTGLTEDASTKEIFLLFILDKPTRTSAWQLTTSIRLTALALVNLVVPEDQRIQTVTERSRQENGSHGRQWMLPNFGEIAEALHYITGIFQKLRNGLPNMTGSDIWRAYAVYVDVENSKANDKTALSVSEHQGHIKRKLHGEETIQWDTIHHIAQLHASYYSLRVLHQILTLILSIPIENTSFPPEVRIDSLRELLKELSDLPPLAALPGFNEERNLIPSSEMAEVLEVVHTMLGMGTRGINEPSESKKSKKKSKKKVETEEAAGGRKKSSNPFDTLIIDQEGINEKPESKKSKKKRKRKKEDEEAAGGRKKSSNPFDALMLDQE